MTILECAFWAGVAIVCYAYLGYPLVAWMLAALAPRPARPGDALPTITMLVAAHNEEGVIAAKLENALALDYPPDRLEIMVVADGCADRTVEIAERYADRGVRVIQQLPRQGKIAALNHGVPLATGELVVGSDANAMYRPDALRRLARWFADPEVGLVAGEKRVHGRGTAAAGEGFYWRYEHWLKHLDSRFGSVMGATGEIFAIRKALWKPLPGDTVIEDFVIAMGVVGGGHRAVFDPAAISEEEASPSVEEEFKRKTRIAAGGWQAVWRLRHLISPAYGMVAFQYVSHRVLRWVVVPPLLPLLFALNVVLSIGSAFWSAMLAIQLALYALGALGWSMRSRGESSRLVVVPFYFAYLNAAALVGGWRFVTNSQPVTWEKVRRPAPSRT